MGTHHDPNEGSLVWHLLAAAAIILPLFLA